MLSKHGNYRATRVPQDKMLTRFIQVTIEDIPESYQPDTLTWGSDEIDSTNYCPSVEYKTKY